MAQPINNFVTVNVKLKSDMILSTTDVIKNFADKLTTIEVNEETDKSGAKYVCVELKYDNSMYDFIEGAYNNGCYSFWAGILEPTDELEINDTTSLDPKNLTEDDITMLEIVNTYLPKELLHMYLMIKDLLDSRINVEELIDNLREYVYSLSK